MRGADAAAVVTGGERIHAQRDVGAEGGLSAAARLGCWMVIWPKPSLFCPGSTPRGSVHGLPLPSTCNRCWGPRTLVRSTNRVVGIKHDVDAVIGRQPGAGRAEAGRVPIEGGAGHLERVQLWDDRLADGAASGRRIEGRAIRAGGERISVSESEL